MMVRVHVLGLQAPMHDRHYDTADTRMELELT